MLPLNQIQTAIKGLSSLPEEGIVSGISDIIYSLMHEDQPLYLATSQNQPVAAPTSNDKQHLYLRLFSHHNLAENYAIKHDGTHIEEVSIIESVQLVRAALNAGIYGLVLNEGDKWIAVRGIQYIEVFCRRCLSDDSLYDATYANCVSFLCELKSGNQMHYGIQETGDIVEITPSDIPLSYAQLDTLVGKNVKISALGGCFSISGDLISAAVREFGWDGTAITEINMDGWRNLQMEELFFVPPVLPEKAEERKEPEPEIPPQSENHAEPVPEKPIKENKSLQIPKGLSDVGGFLREKAAAAGEKIKKVSSNKDKNQSSAKDSETPTPETPEDIEKKKKKKKMILIASAFVAVLLILLSVMLVRNAQRNRMMKEFCGYIDDRNYGQAYTVYTENSLGKPADDYMRENMDSLVLAYANNEISAEELMASLRSYSNFPAIEQSLVTAQVMAAKLETSKNSYVEGKNASDTYTKLNLWRQVIDLDAVNFAAVQQAVSAEYESNVSNLGNDIVYYSTRNKDFAVARYDVLAYWYPESEVTSRWADLYESERTSPLAYYPIRIDNLILHQSPSGYWSVHIDWENISAKRIEEVCFSLVAIDSEGNPVVNNDTDGSWTIFDGRDIGPYDPGTGPTDKDYIWTKAFYGSNIATVKVTAVNVYYSSSQTPDTFTESIDLKSIFPSD